MSRACAGCVSSSRDGVRRKNGAGSTVPRRDASVLSSADPEKGWGIALGRAPASRTRQHRTGSGPNCDTSSARLPASQRVSSLVPSPCSRHAARVPECARRGGGKRAQPLPPMELPPKDHSPEPHPPVGPPTGVCALLEVPRHLETRQLAQRRGWRVRRLGWWDDRQCGVQHAPKGLCGRARRHGARASRGASYKSFSAPSPTAVMPSPPPSLRGSSW
jgi:hypothetical protein